MKNAQNKKSVSGFCFLLFLLIIGCNSYDQSLINGIDIPVMENTEVILEKSIFGMKQLTLRANKTYPNIDMLHKYDAVFTSQQFIKCLDNSPEWEMYIDSTMEQPKHVFQIINHYANYEHNILGMIILKFESDVDSNPLIPDNSNQYVIILQYLERNLDRELDRLRVNCR